MCEFEWNPAKAVSNNRKHNISFDLAKTIFFNPFVMSILDNYHSTFEERWISIGMDEDDQILVVSHTFVESDHGNITVRIISARRATRNERIQYESNQ